MAVLVVTPAKALQASANNCQFSLSSHAAQTLHFHPLSNCLRCPKRHPYIGHASYEFRTRSTPLRLSAVLGDDLKSNQDTRRRTGQFLGRFLKRGRSETSVSDDDSQGTVNDSATRQGSPEDRFGSKFEVLEDGSEPLLKPIESVNFRTSMTDRLLEASLTKVNQAKELATQKANQAKELATQKANQAKELATQTSNKTKEIARLTSNYFSSVDASLGTPTLPYLGDRLSYLGLGSIVLVALILASWWRKWLLGEKTEGSGSTSAADIDAQTQQVLNAQAAVAAPVALSMLLQSDMKKKESAEWLNMVLGKVWSLYRRKLESTLVEAIQPVIDEIPEKPPHIERVVLKQFFLGDEPVTLRTIERRTSRRANDLQYHVGLRYTGNSRMVFSIALKFGFMPIKIPIAIRGLDLDGEVWVKLRLIPTEPWVGSATWAFVSPPKVKLALAPFRLFNLMAVPLLNIFLTKLLTQDLPLLFVRPNKQVVNYLKGKVAGPLPRDFKDGVFDSKGFAGELSVTLIEARKLNYFPLGKTDPYVVFLLGEQAVRSKRNSKTSIIGPPGAPVWNQDFRMLVVDPKTQKLKIRVRDFVGYLGLTTITVGYIEIPIDDLQDTVPVDKVLTLRNDRWFFLGRNAGELLLRLTYKAYVAEEEEEAGVGDRPVTNKVWNEIGNFISKEMEETDVSPEKRQLRDAIVMSVDAGRSENGFRFSNPLMTQSTPAIKKPSSVTINPLTGHVNPNTLTSVPPISSSSEPVPPISSSFEPVPPISSSSEPVPPISSSFEPVPPISSSFEPVIPASQSNPAQEDLKVEGETWASKFDKFRQENANLLWLAIVTGVALAVALDLNISNVFNP